MTDNFDTDVDLDGYYTEQRPSLVGYGRRPPMRTCATSPSSPV